MAIFQWNLAQLNFGTKSMKCGILLNEIWQTENNWKKWQRINEIWHTSGRGIKFHFNPTFPFTCLIWSRDHLNRSHRLDSSISYCWLANDESPNRKFAVLSQCRQRSCEGPREAGERRESDICHLFFHWMYQYLKCVHIMLR